MRNFDRLVAVALLCAVSAGARADGLRPGQWEVTRSTNDAAHIAKVEEMRRKLAAMPPAQRERMEKLMGISGAPGARPGSMVVRTCITPEQARQAELATTQDAKCKREIYEKTARTYHVKTRCPSGSTSEFTGTLNGDTGYDGDLILTMPGLPAPQKTHVSAKWLGPTCAAP